MQSQPAATIRGRETLAFYGGTAILPDRLVSDAVLISTHGRISAIGSSRDLSIPHGAVRVDARGGYIAPGYVDIHCHGGDGTDFMDATAPAIVTALRAHARHGTTTMFPTTTTASPRQLERMLRACIEVRDRATAADGARIGGVHFYGPYFAERMVGVHTAGFSRAPDPDEYMRFFDLGIIRVATCAAELPGCEAFYREAHRRGYLVTCGHSNSTWPEMQRAFDAGMRHVDHFWCAMSSVKSLRDRFKQQRVPMHASMEQFVLANGEMSTEVLADGCHLSPELLRFAFQMKGPERLCLVTDSNRAMGMPPGRYRFGPRNGGAVFHSDGRVGYQKPGYRLASTVVGMEVMVRNMVTMSGTSLCDTVRMASLTPAQRTGMGSEIGSLECGKRADVLILSADLSVKRTFIGGQEFQRTPLKEESQSANGRGRRRKTVRVRA